MVASLDKIEHIKTSLTARHFDLTDALVQHITDKIQNLIHHFSEVNEADFVLNYEQHHNQHIAEVRMHIPGNSLHFTESTDDMYASIDTIISKAAKALDSKKR